MINQRHTAQFKTAILNWTRHAYIANLKKKEENDMFSKDS